MYGTPLKNCRALISVKRQRLLRAGNRRIQYVRARQHVFNREKKITNYTVFVGRALASPSTLCIGCMARM